MGGNGSVVVIFGNRDLMSDLKVLRAGSGKEGHYCILDD